MTQPPSSNPSKFEALTWSAIQSWALHLTGFVVFFFLTKLLDPKDFGLFAMIAVLLAVSTVFMDQGLGQALIQRSILEPEHINSAFWVNFATGLILSIATYLSAPYIATIYSEPSLKSLTEMISLVILLRSGSAIQIAILQRSFQFKAIAIRNNLASVLSGLVAVIMAFNGMGVWSLIGQQIVSATVQCAAIWLLSSFRPRLQFSLAHVKDLYVFGLNIIGINFATLIHLHVAKFLIGIFLGPIALGYYAMGIRLIEILSNLTIGSVISVFLPIFSSLQDKSDKLREVYLSSTKLGSIIVFPIFTGLMLIAPIMVPTLFGSKWESSVPIIQLLGVSASFGAVIQFSNTLFVACGKPHIKLFFTLTSAIVKSSLIYIFVGNGIVASAGASSFSVLLMIPFVFLAVKKIIPVSTRTYTLNLLRPLLASIVMAISVTITMHFTIEFLSIPRIFFAITVGIVTYGAASVLLMPTLLEEMSTAFKKR